jgi:hypothetical protein
MSRKRTLSENRKRRAIRRLINEEILLIEQHSRTCDLVISEERRMIREGYNRSEINEGIMDMLGRLPGGFTSYLKQYFIELFLTKLGFDTKSFMGYVLKNCLEEFEFTQFSKYIGQGGCENIVNELIGCLEESVEEKGIDEIMKYFFGSALQGAVSGTVREIATDMLKELTSSIREPIAKFICELDFDQLMSGLKGVFGKITGGGGQGGSPALS